MGRKTLLVAFDGMDKELIEKFDLENIRQKEFGTIDNSTGITRVMTSELFASFITGDTHEEHGITGLKKGQSRRKDSFLGRIRNFGVAKILGFYSFLDLVTEKDEVRKYLAKDLQSETFFSKIERAKSLYIPVHSPDPLFMLGHPHAVKKFGDEYNLVEQTKFNTESRLYEGIGSQPGLFDLTKDFWDFIMIHLHDPDPLQDTGVGDLEERYQKLDSIAQEIIEDFDGWTIIFMSDHGRPIKESIAHEHNENAFYSCNKELFGERTPHITDFYDRILELTRDN